MLGKRKMKIGRLVLLGAFVLGTGFSAEAATLAPRLHAPGATTLTSTDSGKEKKAHHAHKAQKKTVSHKVKKVKKVKKT
jgi:hypothetical protein